MKKNISPVVIGVVAVVLVIAIIIYVFQVMKPEPYTPSPGWDRGKKALEAGQKPGGAPGQPGQPGQPGRPGGGMPPGPAEPSNR